ncbi:MAG TPA: hypothetical protein V6D34_00565, partial [Candidatus Sericytochromatia bacterium]
MKSPALIALSLVAFFSSASAARADALAAPTDNGGAIDLSLGKSDPATLASATTPPAEKQVEKQAAPTEPTTPS